MSCSQTWFRFTINTWNEIDCDDIFLCLVSQEGVSWGIPWFYHNLSQSNWVTWCPINLDNNGCLFSEIEPYLEYFECLMSFNKWNWINDNWLWILKCFCLCVYFKSTYKIAWYDFVQTNKFLSIFFWWPILFFDSIILCFVSIISCFVSIIILFHCFFFVERISAT